MLILTQFSEGKEIPFILANLCSFEPADVEEHFFNLFFVDEIETQIFCATESESSNSKGETSEKLRELISRAHNSFVGHHGHDRTVSNIMTVLHRDKKTASDYSDLDLSKLSPHVKNFIEQCPICQKLKTLKSPIQTQAFTTATYQPHQRLNIDTIGPLPTDDKGNSYVLVVIDTFTRWIELYPTTSTRALEAAEVLIQHFGRYGPAQELQSDNGSQFVNEIIKDLTQLVDSEANMYAQRLILVKKMQSSNAPTRKFFDTFEQFFMMLKLLRNGDFIFHLCNAYSIQL